MSENGPYKINSPDGVEHQVDFEVWLLNHIWRNRTFADNSYGDFRKLIEEEGLVIPTDLQNHIRLKIILLKKGTGVTVITPMKTKSVATSKYLNDVWTNNKMITWVMSSDVKYFILALRKKSFNGLIQTIDKYGPNRSENTKQTEISPLSKIELKTMDWNDQDQWRYLTDTDFHRNLAKCSCYVATDMEEKHGVSFPDGKGQFGYLNESNELIFVVPEIEHPDPMEDFDKYLLFLEGVADTQLDVLTTETGNITLIWSKEIAHDVKTVRKKIAEKTSKS